jgi:hypothetical protein
MAKSRKGMGFNAAAKSAARSAGVSEARGRAIIAASARKASPAAIKKNPNLKRVPGVGKKKRKK